MDFRHHVPGGSPSSSSTTSSSSQNPNHGNGNQHHQNHNGSSTAITTATPTTTTTNNDPMHSWWESISKARSRIHLLSTLLPGPEPDSEDPNPISSLADSDAPARSLLSSLTAYTAVSSSFTPLTITSAYSDVFATLIFIPLRNSPLVPPLASFLVTQTITVFHCLDLHTRK